MARNQNKRKILLDPRFKSPKGSEENFTQSSITGSGSIEDAGVFGNFSGLAVNPSDIVGNPQPTLATPTVFSIIDQNLRIAPGGQEFVDIVVQIDEVPGAIEYEVQISAT